MKCLKGLFESHDSRSRHTVPLAHFSRECSQAQSLLSTFCVQASTGPGETEVGNLEDLPSRSCLWVGSTHMINQTITNKWLIFVMRSLWWRENTETYDGVSDLLGKVCGSILEEIMFELRSKDILVKTDLGRGPLARCGSGAVSLQHDFWAEPILGEFSKQITAAFWCRLVVPRCYWDT